ncbi:MAG TPA: class II fructose-bisphosphate aldolase [Propionibacteriaceae bacterium]|nr:class II fructose-bisphosphate aldolase [Propionibacteriaceae bacterium]
MAVQSLTEILAPAFRQRYGVPAINILNDLTIENVLAGAVEARSPVILQTSVKTVRSIGVATLYGMWSTMTAGIEIPCALHLDHCPDRQVISDCLAAGWNSVLFDASQLPVEENQRQTIEVVAEARRYGADVEGEIESITGQEDGVGSDDESKRQTLEVQLRYLEATQVDVFAPAIGNAHGTYKRAPVLDFGRVSDLVAAHPIPIALHGGSGLSVEQFQDCISRGCAKVNISTALKETYMKSNLAFLRKAEEAGKWDPPSLFTAVGADVREMTKQFAEIFGSAGKA